MYSGTFLTVPMMTHLWSVYSIHIMTLMTKAHDTRQKIGRHCEPTTSADKNLLCVIKKSADFYLKKTSLNFTRLSDPEVTPLTYLGIDTILPGNLLSIDTYIQISENWLTVPPAWFWFLVAGVRSICASGGYALLNTVLYEHFKDLCLDSCSFLKTLLCLVVYIQYVTQMRLTFVQYRLLTYLLNGVYLQWSAADTHDLSLH